MLEEQIINAIHIYSANISEQQTKYNHLSSDKPCEEYHIWSKEVKFLVYHSSRCPLAGLNYLWK